MMRQAVRGLAERAIRMAAQSPLRRSLLRKALVVFLYHEVSDTPSPFSRKFRLNVPPALFARQLDLIREHFHLIDPPALLKGDYPTPAALITFDDGNKSVFENALPLLRKKRSPSLIFLNLGPIQGEACWSGLVTYLQHFEPAFLESRGKGLSDPYEFRFFTFSEVDRYLESVDREKLLERVRLFRGPVADEQEIESVRQDPWVFLGNHLYQHYNATLLDGERFRQEYRKNQRILDSHPRGVRLFSYPFSCSNPRTDALLQEEGVEGIFAGQGLPNWNGQGSHRLRFYHRVELDDRTVTESDLFSAVLRNTLPDWVRNRISLAGFSGRRVDSHKGWAFVRQVHQGKAFDLDSEIRKAYETYPFPYPVDTDYSQYTPERARRLLEDFRTANRSLLKPFALDRKSWQGKILWDLGCGVGWRAMAFASEGAAEVHAFDGSENALQLGEHFCRLLEIENVRFHPCSLYDIDRVDPKPAPPDLIFSTGTVHHLFDLPRVARALAKAARPGTEFYFTHSSYASWRGLTKYYKNYLSWARGGMDLEERLKAGEAIWRGWIRSTPEPLRKSQLNDLAGVFYMARSPRAIRKTFQEAGFDVQFVPPVQSRAQLLEEWRDRLSLTSSSGTKHLLKKGLLAGLRLLCAPPLPAFLDRALAGGISWLFEMRPFYFKAVYRGGP